MCGIVGIVSRNVIQRDGRIDRMTECLRHRGPDDMHIAFLPECHLGHCRLSVIDIAGGKQPMSDETRRYWIVFNGEIFNYRELREVLKEKGWTFRTESDTEVLLRACQEYGDETPLHLNGQFAFAFWDNKKKNLFAARDRMGEKPFYWAMNGRNDFIFASEIKALLMDSFLRPSLNELALNDYMSLNYISPDQTIYEEVRTLQPGHVLRFENGHVREWCYWQPQYSVMADISLDEAVNRCRSLIEQAVKRQMVADVSVGAFLSGGLDSSTIVALMSKHAKGPVKTFSVGFGKIINELPWANIIAKRYKTEHHEIQMDIPVGEMLEKMVDVYDEPFADSSNIPTFLISQFASKEVKVVLSGDGGDEIFGGYEWYSHLLNSEKLESSEISSLLRLAVIKNILRVLAKFGVPCKAARDQASLVHYYGSIHHNFTRPIDRHLAFLTGINRADDYREGLNRIDSLRKTFCPVEDSGGVDQAISFDINCYLPGDILVKVDRAAMANGLEVRAPFLDVDLVEFLLAIPWKLRFKHMELKYLLRNACQDLWPSEIQVRSKQGFGAPVREWLERGDVKEIRQRIFARNSSLSYLFPNANKWPHGRNPQRCWALLCFGLWLEKHDTCLRHL
ncbi:MAG: asparagine synthase (glutamine-hydrolyzing) [Kiritimatiellae bacterium]|nr:asparagine synthase (glutamine-hydrolyzing) [Kiritimatiellia bacterium]MDD5523059.1 asparagine synthase (glutamine-hydrolyzing) [Kiritimatiellia bacterium]